MSAPTKKLLRNGVAHPAVYSDALLPVFAGILDDGRQHPAAPMRILDPFAGTGRIHRLTEAFHCVTWGIEIEPEWAELHAGTLCADALSLPFTDGTFDAICTSPTYANRMADHHDARDDSVRRTYKHDLGRDLHPNSSGRLQWGQGYRDFHERAWREAVRVLRPEGIFVLNCKDHIRAGEQQRVSAWHVDTLTNLGLELVEQIPVETPNLRVGSNRNLRLTEWVFVLERSRS